jgi:hypothetical protein
MNISTELTTRPTLIVLPWLDQTVERNGFDPRGRYAELFVLPVLGPTATWLLRRLVEGLDASPDGYELDLAQTAGSLGLSITREKSGPFTRAFHRCLMFGYAQPVAYGLAVRRMISPLAPRQLDLLPAHLRALHGEFVNQHGPEVVGPADRAAMSLIGAGLQPETLERTLIGLGHHPGAATEAARRVRLRTLTPA